MTARVVAALDSSARGADPLMAPVGRDGHAERAADGLPAFAVLGSLLDAPPISGHPGRRLSLWAPRRTLV
jgi:hypothetical protein